MAVEAVASTAGVVFMAVEAAASTVVAVFMAAASTVAEAVASTAADSMAGARLEGVTTTAAASAVVLAQAVTELAVARTAGPVGRGAWAGDTTGLDLGATLAGLVTVLPTSLPRLTMAGGIPSVPDLPAEPEE